MFIRPTTPFGIEVKKALIDKRMTQKSLADKLGITPRYVDYILTGERNPEKYVLEMAKILEIEPPKAEKKSA